MPFDLKPNSLQRNPQSNDQKFDHYFKREQPERQDEIRPQESAEIEAVAHNESFGKIIHSWEAPEFEVYEKSARWYLIAGLLDVAMAVYGIISNSPIMAITFIMIGIVGYIQLNKDPRILTFTITTEGIMAGRELYSFENIKSFWIFYDPPHTKIISLHTKAGVFPFVHIPLAGEDPVRLRETIFEYIPETKQEQSLIDTLEKVLHI